MRCCCVQVFLSVRKLTINEKQPDAPLPPTAVSSSISGGGGGAAAAPLQPSSSAAQQQQPLASAAESGPNRMQYIIRDNNGVEYIAVRAATRSSTVPPLPLAHINRPPPPLPHSCSTPVVVMHYLCSVILIQTTVEAFLIDHACNI